MATPREPLFLGRDSYRRRRLADAARLLPLVGVILLMIPLIWGERDGQAPATATAGLYVFGVWTGLIIASYVLALRLARTDPENASSKSEDASNDAQPVEAKEG